MLLVLPVAAVVLAVAAQFYRAEAGRLHAAELAAGDGAIASAAATAAGRIDEVARDLSFLVRDLDLDGALDHGTGGALGDGAAPSPALLQRWAAFSTAKGRYDQIRWIGADGRERLRIDLRQGRALVLPAPALADKQARYYFNETLRLPAGSLYVSPMDLNVEQGRVEQPPKPVLRVASPVFAADGTARGIVVLNYLGRDLLDALREAGGPHLRMTNAEGQWLIGPAPQDEFGFMLGQPALGLAASHPAAWARMAGVSHGQFQDDEATWTFRRVVALHDVQVRVDGLAGASVTWLLADRRPLTLIAAPLAQARLRIGGVALGALLLVFAAAWWLTRSRVELASAARSAAAANQAKTDFLAEMSHQIRIPLQALIGMSSLLERDARDTRLRALSGRIRAASRMLQGIVDDVLDITRIESGELVLDKVPFRLDLVLRDIEALMTGETLAKGLSLNILPLPAGLPPQLLGDGPRVRQILLNLLHNAIKFTDEGQVVLEVLQEAAAEPGRVRLRLEVRDTGVGIAAEQQAQVFGRFVQAENASDRRAGGSGLGLAIVRRLAGLMDGEAGLRSEPGHGSTFWVTLQLPVADAAAGPALPAGRFRLLAGLGDARDRASLLAAARALGWSMQSMNGAPPDAAALSAAVAEAMAEDARCGRAPDVLLLDPALLAVQGPGPSEAGLAVEPAAGSATGPATGSATEAGTHGPAQPLTVGLGQPARPGEAGLAQAWLVAPINDGSLYTAVAQAVFDVQGGDGLTRLAEMTVMDAPDLEWLPDVRLLLVDDNEINLEVTSHVLRRDGAMVSTCRNGLEALGRLQSVVPPFDVVLMDLQMPGIDGFETTRRIRALPALRDLPVLALSGDALATQRQRASDSGMSGFLAKPIDPPVLVRTIRQQLEQRQARPWPVRARPAEDPGTHGADGIQASWPTIDGIDATAVESRLGGDGVAFLRLLDQFCQRAADLAQASTVVPPSAAERQALARRLHRIRGGAQLLGAVDVARLARETETALVSDEAGPAEAALTRLTAALRLLAGQAAPWLAGQRAARSEGRAEASTHAAALVPAEVAELIEMLRRHELAALARYRAMAPSLEHRLGAERMQALDSLLDRLDFDQSVQVLSEAFAEA